LAVAIRELNHLILLIIPKEIEKEAFEGAVEKERGVQLVKIALENGMSTVDAFSF
jgi:hypothetical protein